MPRPWRLTPSPPRLSSFEYLLQQAARLVRHIPPSVIGSVLGPAPQNQRGEALDAHVHMMLVMQKQMAVQEHLTVADRRHKMRRDIAMVDGPLVRVGGIVETVLDGDLPVRVYRPASTGHRPPWMLYLHGGGWAAGDLDSHDRFCRRLCRDSGLLVIALDYRLSPEVPFPGALEDVLRAWPAAAELAKRLGADPSWASIGGDSAGGNLTAVFCHRYRDTEVRGPPPRLQLMVYPAMDFRLLEASLDEFKEGYLLTRESIDIYKAMYAAPDDTHPDASPLLQPDLTHLPHTILITAGFDPLRDEGERFVGRAQEAGTRTVHLAEPSLVHGFLQLDSAIPAADEAVYRITDAIETALAQHRP